MPLPFSVLRPLLSAAPSALHIGEFNSSACSPAVVEGAYIEMWGKIGAWEEKVGHVYLTNPQTVHRCAAEKTVTKPSRIDVLGNGSHTSDIAGIRVVDAPEGYQPIKPIDNLLPAIFHTFNLACGVTSVNAGRPQRVESRRSPASMSRDLGTRSSLQPAAERFKFFRRAVADPQFAAFLLRADGDGQARHIGQQLFQRRGVRVFRR